MPKTCSPSLVRSYLSKTPEGEWDDEAIAYLSSIDCIAKENPIVAKAIQQELQDQRSNLKLIASENYCSLTVQLAMGNLLTDKYAEGFPHHRFYAGCENIDAIEEEAATAAKELFQCDHSYVQPHSGADANLVAFWSILQQRLQPAFLERAGQKNLDALTPQQYEELRQLLVNQTLVGMSLNSGGHLTHGYRLNVSSKMMRAVTYDVDPETGFLDEAQVARIVKQEKPAILLAGYSAYPRRINFAKMREIADSVGATFMVDMAHFSGLVAGKVFTGEENPIPYAHIVTTTTHKTLRGPRGGLLLSTKEFADTINRGCPLILGGPLPNVMAAKAIAFREAQTPAFQEYSQNIVANARHLADRLRYHQVPMVTGGTDNHLVVCDVSALGLTGRQAETALREAHITVNRNTIPFDINGPWYTSGIRIGSPALTTLGMGKHEMHLVADLIVETLKNTKPTLTEKGELSRAKCAVEPKTLQYVKGAVSELLHRFPLYPNLPVSC